MSNFRNVSMDDDNLVPPQVEKFVQAKNKTDRVAILNPTNFKSAKTHYIKDRGSFICLSKEGISGACEKYGPPLPYYVFVIFHYYTDDKEGLVPNAERFRSGNLGELKFWKIPLDKLQRLKLIHKQASLLNHDILVRCTDAKFQKQDFTQCMDSWLISAASVDPNIRQRILTEAEANLDQSARLLGRTLTEDQLEEFVTGQPSRTEEEVASGGGVRPASLAAPVEEFDKILDSITNPQRKN